MLPLKVIKWLRLIIIFILAAIAYWFVFQRYFSNPPKKQSTLTQESTGLQEPSCGDTIVEASIGEPSILNPVLATDSSSGDINGYLYNGLVKYDKDLHLVGDLAESWEIRKGGKQIVFHLRRGVQWHDGVPFTSRDVGFTYHTLVSSATRTPYSTDYLIIENVEAPDDYTFIVNYSTPFSPALESWGMGIIARHIYENGDINMHSANRNPIGTGPYCFKEWKTGEWLLLEANEKYFEGRPYIDRIFYRIVPDLSVQFLELYKGNIDLMSLTPDQYKRETEGKIFIQKFNKFRYPSFSYAYLGYNLSNELFKDKRVRQAFAHAIDKQRIIDGVLLGLGQPATGPFPPTSWACCPEVKDMEYNPQAAVKLLKSCGWQDTDNDGILDRDGRKFEFTILTNQGNKMRELAAQLIQEDLARLGVQVNIRIVEWSTFIHQFIDARNFEAVLLGWSLSRDPDQYSIWHTSQIREGGYNFVGYSNPEVDKLLEQGRRTFGLEKRQKIYWKIHQLIADDQPYLFLYVSDSLPVVHKRFHGIEPAPAGIGYNFIRWYVPERLQRYAR